MGLLSFFTSQADEIIDSVGEVIDETFTSDEERLQAKNKLVKIKATSKQNAKKLEFQYEQEITKRWTNDNLNFITRMVRPFMAFFSYFLFGAIVLSDGNIGQFSINESYIPIIESLLITITIAYVGGRSLEKINGVKNEK